MVKTIILIENKTREILKTVGRKDQTYDDIINELLRIRKKNTIQFDNNYVKKEPNNDLTGDE